MKVQVTSWYVLAAYAVHIKGTVKHYYNTLHLRNKYLAAVISGR